MTDEPSKVVEFPNSEERAHRLRVEVERLARLPTVEWMLYVTTESHAAKYGVDCATLKKMVEAVIKETEKKAREEKVEQQRIEQRAEKQRDTAKRDEERKRGTRGTRGQEGKPSAGS